MTKLDVLIFIILFVFPPLLFVIVSTVASNSTMSDSKNPNRDLLILLAILGITLAAVTGFLGYFGKL